MWNCDFLDLYFAAINGHHGEGDLLIESALSTASRVQPKDTIYYLLSVFMRMTVNNNIRIVQLRGDIFLVMNRKDLVPSC